MSNRYAQSWQAQSGAAKRIAPNGRFASPRLLQTRAQLWRSRLLYGALGAAFLALGARSLYLQTMSQPFLQAKGAQTYERTLELPANRGRIVDRNGVELASSLPAAAISLATRQLDTADPRLMDIAHLLGMEPADLSRRITQSESPYITLRHQVDQDTAERIRALRVRGVVVEPEFKRVYPQGEMAAQLVGFTNFEHVGQEGLELSFQQYLTGRPGSRRVVRDGGGQVIAALDQVREPRDGRDLKLTIDRRIQSQTYATLQNTARQFKAKAAAAVVLDTQTGDILALANWPSYDPNDRSSLTGEQLRNRVITDGFEPGSTIKPFTAAMALESGRFRPTSIIDVTTGRLTVGRDTIHDSHRHKEPLTLEQIVQKSSNVGIAKVALDLPAERLGGLLDAAGFGHAPRIGFPGAVAGRLRDPSTWKPIEHVTISYGHGMSVSLLQLAHAYTIFGNQGRLLPISLFRPADEDLPVRTLKVGTRGVPEQERPEGTPVIKPETASMVRRMLEMAVDKEGTSPEARISGYRVGGKTGTAHKLQNGRYVDRYVSSFVGLAPMSNPRIVVAVMVDEPQGKAYYGGQVAGPAFASIAQDALRVLRVEPDAPFSSLIAPARDEDPGTLVNPLPGAFSSGRADLARGTRAQPASTRRQPARSGDRSRAISGAQGGAPTAPARARAST